MHDENEDQSSGDDSDHHSSIAGEHSQLPVDSRPQDCEQEAAIHARHTDWLTTLSQRSGAYQIPGPGRQESAHNSADFEIEDVIPNAPIGNEEEALPVAYIAESVAQPSDSMVQITAQAVLVPVHSINTSMTRALACASILILSLVVMASFLFACD